jgi:hypothetical protein
MTDVIHDPGQPSNLQGTANTVQHSPAKGEMSPHQQLQMLLDYLKSDCISALKEEHKNRHMRNRIRARTLLWWVAASTDSAFDELINCIEYAGRKVNHGKNFSGVLKHLYGDLMSDQDRNKESRLLNALLQEYERNTETYSNNAEEKLAGYIQGKGGFVNLVKSTYSNAEIETASNNELLTEVSIADYEEQQAAESQADEAEIAGWGFKFKLKKRMVLKESKKVGPEATYKKLLSLASTKVKKIKTITPIGNASVIQRTPEGYSLVLLKHENNSTEIIHDCADKELIDKLFVDAYSNDLTECAAPLRGICEIMLTQALPFHGKFKENDLVEVIQEASEDQPQVLAHHRLLYKHEGKEILFSPMHSVSGVITRAQPKSDWIAEPTGDLAMTGISRNTVRSRLLAQATYNHYETEGSEVIKQSGVDPTFTHVLHVKHKADEKNNFNLTFHTFAEGGKHNHAQLELDSQWEPDDSICIPVETVKAIGKSLANPWLKGIENHIMRPRNAVTKLAITDGTLIVSYEKDVEEMAQIKAFQYATTIDPEQPIKSMSFLSKDFMTVLSNLSYLPITTDVTFKVTDELLVLDFETSIAKYEIVVPTVDESKKCRRSAGLVNYSPQPRVKSAQEIENERLENILNSFPPDESFEEDVLVEQQSETTVEI